MYCYKSLTDKTKYDDLHVNYSILCCNFFDLHRSIICNTLSSTSLVMFSRHALPKHKQMLCLNFS